MWPFHAHAAVCQYRFKIQNSYEDGKTAIFIDDKNYKEMLQEHLDGSDDSRWKRGAQSGKKHAPGDLSNGRGAEMPVRIIRKTLE